MTTQIKITQLTDIGGSINQNTLVPVVNMAGTPTTQKANLQIVGNLILNNAGNGFPSANASIYSQSVTNAAQPNITSVGTLTSLTVAGNVNLGSVANLRITGGSVGQVLSTDGAGNLSWASDGTSYSNSNVANYLPTYTGNISGDYATLTHDVEANVVYANYLYGDGSNITNVAFAANSTNANTADIALGVDGANVSGTVANAEFANTVFVEAVNNNFSYHVVLTTGPGDTTLHNDIDDSFQYNPQDGILTVTRVDATYFVGNLDFAHGLQAANVVGLGNIAGINLNGNNQTYLAGNGAFANIAIPTVGNIAVINLDGNTSNILRGDGSWGISNYVPAYIKTTPILVGALPNPATVGGGSRAFVTDADSTTFNAPAVGGGANNMPVFTDGTSWFIG